MYSLTEVELDHPALVALFAGLSDALGGGAADEAKLSYTEAGLLTAVVAWHDGKAVGCGLLRQADSSKAEIKRMYSVQAGVGSAILHFLEQKALTAGFQSVLASVRIINGKALNFYLHKGYKKCPSYGKYRYSSQHMCLEKPLSRVVTV